MHVVVFFNIRSVIATGGSLLPRAAPVHPRARRWEAPVATAPLLLPCVCRRWEALATAAPFFLPRARRRLHRMTQLQCGWSAAPLLLYAWWLFLLLQHAWWLLLLLWHAWGRFHPTTPPRTARAITTNDLTSKRWAHLYELRIDFNCLVELLSVYTFIFIFKS
jgi:hypothetical protein